MKETAENKLLVAIFGCAKYILNYNVYIKGGLYLDKKNRPITGEIVQLGSKTKIVFKGKLVQRVVQKGEIEELTPDTMIRIMVKNGIPDGWEKRFYKGKLAMKTPYKCGVVAGWERVYGVNGELWLKTRYIDGKRNGVQQSFHENGTVECETHFKNDKKHGREWWFSKKGKPEMIILYNKDIPVYGASISNAGIKTLMSHGELDFFDPNFFDFNER